jgi:hypothetical protein
LADRIWASGFFDGEGCVNLTRDTGGHVKAQVVIVNTALDVLEWYRERWGGAIYKHKPGTARQPAFQWQLEIPRIPAFLEDIRPYMHVKVAQTDNCLSFVRLRLQRRKHSRMSADEKLTYEPYLKAHRALDLTHGGQAAHRKSRVA